MRSDCGVCVGDLEGGACPEKKTNLSPLELSEKLCMLGLANRAEHTRVNGNGQRIRYAWACLEVALSASEQEFYSRFVEKQTNEAFATVDEILDTKNGFNVVQIAEAANLKCFETLFRARCNQQPISEEQIAQTARDLGELILEVDPNKVPVAYQGSIRGKRAELEVEYLLLKTGKPEHIPWIASSREDGSSQAPLNHDFYKLEGDDKLPVQVKYSHHPNTRRYADSVVIIFYTELLERIRNRAGAQGVGKGDFLPNLIKNDLRRGSGKKQRILTNASEQLVTMIEERRKRRKNLAQEDNLALL